MRPLVFMMEILCIIAHGNELMVMEIVMKMLLFLWYFF